MAISFSWTDIEDILSMLVAKIVGDGRPNVIAGLQRGGLVPAVMLSHRLSVREFMTVDVSSTVSDEIDALKTRPHVQADSAFLAMKGRDILLVDDVVGTGASLRAVRALAQRSYPLRLRSVVCAVNKDNWERSNVTSPREEISYIGREVNGWIVFPWEQL